MIIRESLYAAATKIDKGRKKIQNTDNAATKANDPTLSLASKLSYERINADATTKIILAIVKYRIGVILFSP